MGVIRKQYDVITIVLFFLFAVFLEYTEAFSLVEDETLSYRHLLRTYYADQAVTAPSDDVVIIYTDESFYEEYDKFPLRRTDLATIIVRLKEMGAVVIAVDMLLDFNSAYGEDPTLEDAMQEAGNVQLVSQAQFAADQFLLLNKAIPRFDVVTASGYSNISANSSISESIVRLRIYPQVSEESGEWPFAVKAVANFLGTDQISLDEHVLQIGEDLSIQLDQFNDLYIDYPLLPANGIGGASRLHEVVGLSASEIIFAEDEEELEELAFLVEGKIVLIGEVAEVAHDEFETPVGNVYGVSIIADTIATLLKGGTLRPASFIYEVLLALIMMCCFIATKMITNPLPRNSLSIGLVAAFVVGASLLYVYSGLIISVSYILLASMFSIAGINAKFYLAEMGQKALIKDAFGQYLSPSVVSDLVKDPDKLTLGGELREMTAYFSDIARFSSFSEKMTPPELVLALNEYLTEMCNIIIGMDGTIDKFEGDAIIAFWGAPGIQEQHAKLACLASIDMNNSLVSLRQSWEKMGRPAINVRMGLNTGEMVVGNMGSAQRMDYTMMGDAVNLAARLEGANKAYGSDLMISEATYLQTKDFVDVRELDTIRVVGKSEAIKVYQLLERKDKTQGLVADLISQYNKAHELYKERDYVAAKAGFKLALAIAQEDGPSKTYVDRCEQYINNPPRADWDGVFTLDSKG